MKKKNIGMIVVVVLLVIAVSTYVKQQIAKDRELEINESLLGKAMDLNYKQTGLRKGDTPPDFTLTTMDGKEVTLSDYKGKKVILNFWASWCPPCKAEMPHMQKYYDKKAEEQNFEILAVNLTSEEKSNRLIEKFLQSYGITFPVPLDEKGNIALKYQVITIPSTFILNTDGQIEHSIIGPMNEDLLETYVEGIN
ncbi:Sporulation thiol-disulfide oxidoreductase A precursor [Metalysinibacillus saudimassiliensis]|uniref:Sporulation thiol-disulfide oxidoreductase A n=1 Tax=Metalysinibacillus saudimassiliensis TaxID=1461583 RepID=A0A078M799_9BACL|nr:Sporulation thiol-disulfide oxidoreductase A precursor [Metalysinibacillus saudimassiliensis]